MLCRFSNDVFALKEMSYFAHWIYNKQLEKDGVSDENLEVKGNTSKF